MPKENTYYYAGRYPMTRYVADTQEEKALCDAVKDNNIIAASNYILQFMEAALPDEIKKLCYPDLHAKINKEYINYCTLPLIAAINNNIDMLYLLINFGFDINLVSGAIRMTPLAYAVKEEHADIRNLLLQQPNIEVNNCYFNLPLELAIEKGNIEVVKLLEQKGAITSPFSAISLAFSSPNPDIFKYYFEKELPSITENKLGSLLRKAAESGKAEVAKFLLEHEPKFDYGENIAKSFILAAKRGHLKICYILKYEANIEEPTRQVGTVDRQEIKFRIRLRSVIM